MHGDLQLTVPLPTVVSKMFAAFLWSVACKQNHAKTGVALAIRKTLVSSGITWDFFQLKHL